MSQFTENDFLPPVPINDYILVEPIEIKREYILPDTAEFLAPARVLDMGSEMCMPQYMEKGIGPLISKRSITTPWNGQQINAMKPGDIVLYRKVAEERMTMDGAYRRILPDGRSVILVKILDVIATLPPLSHDHPAQR